MPIMQRQPLATAWVSRSAIDTMFSEADRTYPCETGGVLMGYWAVPYTEVVVTRAIGPGPHASHEQFSFIPDYQFHDLEIARVYETSGQLHTYLGDWHSHPASVAYVSKLDSRTLKTIAAFGPARAPVPLMAILGAGAPWELRIWKYVPGKFFRPRCSHIEAFQLKSYETESRC